MVREREAGRRDKYRQAIGKYLIFLKDRYIIDITGFVYMYEYSSSEMMLLE